MTHVLKIESITKAYDSKNVINDVSLELHKGEIGCLLGESGCGKTTVLRCVAGFERIESGDIKLAGLPVSGPGRHVAPENRRLGMVFQDYALFPHLTVTQNILFGLHTLSGQQRRTRVIAMLDLVRLADHADKYPHQLSGGQQQRVALARALAPNPELLLMDEPFSNLDEALREQLCIDVRHILKDIGISALLVTHNQQEAFAMADIIGVIRQGALEQWDTAHNLYHRPINQYVADFVGEGVLINGLVTAVDKVETSLGVLKGPFSYPCQNGCAARVLLRPDDIVHDDASPMKATVRRKRFRGANILYSLELKSNEEVLALVSSHHDHAIGQKIGIRPQVDDIILFAS